jgi:hypothetical protein
LTGAQAQNIQKSGDFDHGYTAWNTLLQKHVHWLPDARQSQVDYTGFADDATTLQQVLDGWSAVTPAAFAAFSRAQQMAFLVNAYNGFTVALILTRYPKLASIRELGSPLQSPWKKRFFTLLGQRRHLDWIEHEQLRPLYADPRVHTAINCASIGCPALRPEAFVAARLDAQLDDGMQRFLADRTRNRMAAGKLQVSSIFKWFAEDFTQNRGGYASVKDLFARYADELADAPADRAALRARTAPITYLDYDWALNDLRR